MKNEDKTKEQLLNELKELHQIIAELKKADTKHKRLEEALKISESRLKSILASMVDMVFALDKEGRFIFHHAPRVEDLYMPPERFLGKRHSEVMPRRLNEIFTNSFKKNKKGESAEYEYWLEIKGKVRWFFAKLSPMFIDREFAGSVAVVREITERKHVEEELKRYREHLEEQVEKRTAELKAANAQLLREITERKLAEEEIRKLSSAVEQSIDGIAIGNLEPELIYVNNAFAQMHDYVPEEMIGMKVVNLHNEKQRDEYKRRIKQIKTQGSWTGEIGHIRKDGTPFLTFMSVTLLKDSYGKPSGILASARDITKAKKAEVALKESEAKLREQKLTLEQKNIALSEIIAQIEIEKRKIKDDIENNVNTVISPILEKLKMRRTPLNLVKLIQHHLENLTSSFGSKIIKESLSLTPREIEICNMVKSGLTSKEISHLLNISRQTVERHRKNIRHKLGISNKPVNLTSFLQEI